MNLKKSIPNRYTLRKIKNCFNNAPVYYSEATTSTMDDALYYISQGTQDGTVLCSGFQSEGRGRIYKRKWFSEPGESLLFTLILSKDSIPLPLPRLPLLFGLALSILCEKEYNFSASIKWPNDIYYKNKKLAGILCKAENDFILCGIGINCNQMRFPDELEMKAVSLRMIIKKEVNIMPFCEKVLVCIKENLNRLDWHKQLVKRLYKTGSKVRVIHIGNDNCLHVISEGILLSIDKDGALLIKENGNSQPKRIISGEVLFL